MVCLFFSFDRFRYADRAAAHREVNVVAAVGKAVLPLRVVMVAGTRVKGEHLAQRCQFG